MGTWGAGPFDNDDAADWVDDLEDAEPDERTELVRAALTAATEHVGPLDVVSAQPAFAAAAIVAAARTDGTLESAYAPRELVDPTDELVALALRALDRVVADDSEWRERWEEVDDLEEAMRELAAVRDALEAVEPV